LLFVQSQSISWLGKLVSENVRNRTCRAHFGAQSRGLVDGITQQITAAAFVGKAVVVFTGQAALRQRRFNHDREDDVGRHQSDDKRPYDVALNRSTTYDHRKTRFTASSAPSAICTGWAKKLHPLTAHFQLAISMQSFKIK